MRVSRGVGAWCRRRPLFRRSWVWLVPVSQAPRCRRRQIPLSSFSPFSSGYLRRRGIWGSVRLLGLVLAIRQLIPPHVNEEAELAARWTTGTRALQPPSALVRIRLIPEFGLAFKPPSPAALPADIPPSTPNMAGSTMIFRATDLNAAWERIRSDVYWTEGVWDRDGCILREYVVNPLYTDVEEQKA